MNYKICWFKNKMQFFYLHCFQESTTFGFGNAIGYTFESERSETFECGNFQIKKVSLRIRLSLSTLKKCVEFALCGLKELL